MTDTQFEFSESNDFVEKFPPELSNTLFAYVSDKDLFSCCQCSLLWRDILNNDQQWLKRCLRRGFAKMGSTNEDFQFGVSHVRRPTATTCRPTPEFALFDSQLNIRLQSLCNWAKYYRQRMHLQKNWGQGIYVVHRLIVPKMESEIIIVNSSSCNGKYLAVGTTLGFVFIWDVSGVPELLTSLEPVQSNKEVEKVCLTTSSYLVVLYEGGIIRVLQKLKNQFCIQYQIKVHIVLKEIEDLKSFRLDTVPRAYIEYIASNSEIKEEKDEIKLWNDMIISSNESIKVGIVLKDILISVNENYVLLMAQNTECYTVWNISNGQEQRVCYLPPLSQVSQTLLTDNMCIFSVQQQENKEFANIANRFAILWYDLNESEESNLVPSKVEFPSPKTIDEICEDKIGKRIAVCSEEGFIASYSFPNKELLFSKIKPCIDNLTVCEERIFYHECDDHLIVSLSWDGDIQFKVSAHVGPIRKICCCGPYLISGGAVRELIVWDKLSGKQIHKVHRQPSRISNLFVTLTSILTVGRDDSPALVGYL